MNIYWIWFNILNLDYVKKINLLRRYRNVEKIYDLNVNELKNDFKLNEVEINSFIDNCLINRAKEINKYNIDNDIGVINILDDYYPNLLKEIYNPPILLYYKGDKELLKSKKVNLFIGRNIDDYGKSILKLICSNFLKNNISIISRNEEVDQCIYNYNVNNIIVLSEGINKNKFINKGIILSEYEYDVIKSKTNLLQRNRILTGLSKETILLQVNILDGANYIVDLALEQGRDISVFPGDVFNNNNKFTNLLINEGANIISDINQLSVYEQ